VWRCLRDSSSFSCYKFWQIIGLWQLDGDTRTDGETGKGRQHIPRYSIASCGKNPHDNKKLHWNIQYFWFTSAQLLDRICNVRVVIIYCAVVGHGWQSMTRCVCLSIVRLDDKKWTAAAAAAVARMWCVHTSIPNGVRWPLSARDEISSVRSVNAATRNDVIWWWRCASCNNSWCNTRRRPSDRGIIIGS